MLSGYSVGSLVSSRGSQLYVAGAPRFNHSGKVIVFTLKNSGNLTVLHSLKGEQVVHTHTHTDKGKKGTTLTRHGPLSTFVPFTDRFVFRQRVVVDGRGRGRTNGRPLGGSTHVLQPGLGEREGLRLQRNAAGANVASFWGSKKAEHHPTCKTKKEFNLTPS